MVALHDAHGSDALSVEGGDGLVDQGEARHAERDTPALAERACDDVRGQEGLPEARGGLQHRALVARRQRSAKFGDAALLMGA